jgi:hypothetical protein
MYLLSSHLSRNAAKTPSAAWHVGLHIVPRVRDRLNGKDNNLQRSTPPLKRGLRRGPFLRSTAMDA